MVNISRRRALAALTGGAAASACAAPVRAPRYDGTVAFRHGVASGDPGEDRVVIWTRVTPDGGGEVPVRWVVARDRDLKAVLQSGEIVATAARDYTVKIDVTGLRPGLRLHYGFLVGDARSPVGRTRTLPRGGVRRLKLGVVSCASHPSGFFNAYEAMARIEDLDAVLHLGDYLYEYGLSGFGGDVGLKLGRIPRPDVEIATLADYRTRHAQYKEEPELQAAHAAAPWIVVWDDHEVANDSWNGGAENHDPGEGDWGARKAAALQAYYEWMPIRDPAPGAAFEAINRSFQFGDLASVIMLETRLLSRTQPLDYATDMGLQSTAWDFSDADAPKPLPPGATSSRARVVPQPFEIVDGRPQPILDWARVRTMDPRTPPRGVVYLPDVRGFLAGKVGDERRMLLGETQEAWLKAELAASRGKGVTWQVLGNQALMARIDAPDLSGAPAPLVEQLEKLQPGIGKFFALTRFKVPMSLDAWDGYPAQRARVTDMIAETGANAVVVTGDSHAAWANEVTGRDGRTRAAVEFGGTSVTSPGAGDFIDPSVLDLDTALTGANPSVKWTDQRRRGFLVLTLTREEAVAEFHTVSSVQSKDYATEVAARFRVAPAEGGVGPLERVQT